ncbi:hypothetical protein GCM10011329_34130 [Stakelama pacifica]|nr:hypothetical protein GCM10011329_34130 [Stakelama pacifica]
MVLARPCSSSFDGPGGTGSDLRTAQYVALYGIALSGLNLAFYKSLETLPLGMAVTIELLGPIVVACNPSRRIDLVWVALALIGLIEILPRDEAVHAGARGTLFALLAALCWGAYILIAKRAQRSEISDLVGFGIAVSAMIVIPVGIVSAGFRLIDIAILPTALCIGILSTAIPYALDYIAIKRLGAETFSLALCVHPAVATLLGAIFLHERITQSAMLATLCMTTAAGGRFVSTAFAGRAAERG